MPDIGQDIFSNAAQGAGLGTGIAPGIGTLIGGIAGAGLGLFEGISQKNQGRKLLAASQYPNYQIPQEILANQERAKQQAETGLPSQQYNLAMRNIQRQTMSAIANAQNLKGGLGTVGTTQSRANDAMGNLDTQNAQARLQNIRNLQNVSNTTAQFRNQAFDWNQKNRYQQNYQYGMSLLGAGNQNIVHGIDSGVAGLMRSGNSLQNLFGGNSGGNPPVARNVDFGNQLGTQGGGYGGSVADNYNQLNTNTPQLTFNQ